MDDITLQILRNRKENGECIICGNKISEKHLDKDYTILTHSLLGDVFVETKHIK